MPEVPTVICQRCKKIIFDGKCLKSRITEVKRNGSYAKCPYCKTWVKIPMIRKRE